MSTISLPNLSACDKTSSPSSCSHHTMAHDMARYIDHTKLAFAPGEDETTAIIQLCKEAKHYGFYAVCVRPQHVSLAQECLSGTPVQVATVIDFPQEKRSLAEELKNPVFGSAPLGAKLNDIQAAVRAGIDELDIVMDIRRFKADITQNSANTLADFHHMRVVAGNIPIKMIIEVDLLSGAEIIQATHWCVEAGLFMVKTSTGMLTDRSTSGLGATPARIHLIHQTMREQFALSNGMLKPIGIKASGGIRTFDQALAVIHAGATRIGASTSVTLVS